MANPTLDYSNPLYTFNSSHTSYTATKTCYLLGAISPQSAGGTVAINGSIIAVGYYAQCKAIVPLLKLVASDVVTVSGASSENFLHVFDTID